MSAKSRNNEAPELPPPPGMRAATVGVGGEEYLLLEFPLPDWTLPASLTESECSVAMAILHGATNDEISRQRKTSIRTVDNQVARIFAKIGVTSRIELAHRLGAMRSTYEENYL